MLSEDTSKNGQEKITMKTNELSFQEGMSEAELDDYISQNGHVTHEQFLVSASEYLGEVLLNGKQAPDDLTKNQHVNKVNAIKRREQLNLYEIEVLNLLMHKPGITKTQLHMVQEKQMAGLVCQTLSNLREVGLIEKKFDPLNDDGLVITAKGVGELTKESVTSRTSINNMSDFKHTDPLLN